MVTTEAAKESLQKFFQMGLEGRFVRGRTKPTSESFVGLAQNMGLKSACWPIFG